MSELESNVFYKGKWYGPDYPDNGSPKGWKSLEDQDTDVPTRSDLEGSRPSRSDEGKGDGKDDDESSEPAKPSDGPPPTHGKGSGREAWASYAESHGVKTTDAEGDDLSREDIVEACRAADVPVE